MSILIALLPLIITSVALVDVVTRDDWQVKHLPKLVWILLIVLLPLIGSIVWFLVGRDWSARAETAGRWASESRIMSRPAAPVAPIAPQPSTEDQLRELEEEIAYWENQERIRALEAQLEERRKGEAGE